jgi:4-amino-4-deoxy-L-arabinose transferase-like glycosyltransferase
VAGRLPLLTILALQAVLSLRMVRANTAFQDEGLYLLAGHLEIAHWLHSSAIPPFAVYFSGAPVIYPPLGALADGLGGLVAARCLSLIFMLGATVSLHEVTRRIFDRQAAFFAAALFAGTASVQFLGAFATYDAMALFLLAFATWLGVRSVRLSPGPSAGFLIAAGFILAAANATKYASVLFAPAVLGTVILATWQARGQRAALQAAAIMAGVFVASVGAGLAVGGRIYWRGVEFTTLARVNGGAPRFDVLYLSGEWVGLIVVLAVIGAMAVSLTVQGRAVKVLAWLLAVTSILAPAEQARIHTLTSLFKHVGYGAWFASIVAGLALASFPLAVPKANARRAFRLSMTVAILAGVVGSAVASTHFAGWPNTQRINSIIASRLTVNGNYLAEDDDALSYYFSNRLAWQQWTSTWFFRYVDPEKKAMLSGAPAYADAIKHSYFNMIILSFGDTLSMDHQIKNDIKHFGGYRLIAVLPYVTTSYTGKYFIWVRHSGPER